MLYSPPLLEGIFLKRYKRFFADIKYQGQIITAHLPNTGSMKGCNTPNSPCRFSINENPNRKLKYTLEMMQTPTSWVGVNTHLPNQLIWEAWKNQHFTHWKIFNQCQKEIKINDESRIDFAFWNTQSPERKHFVEVKNVSLVENGIALFPDAVTTRGQKHLRELLNLMEQGHSAEILFTIQRDDAEFFAPASHIDADYAELFHKAQKKGLLVTPIICSLSPHEIKLSNQILAS